MISFLKGLLSSDGIVKAGMAAIDKSILTEEEERDMQLEFIKSTLPMNVSRRVIACAITFMWVITGIWIMILISMESPIAATAKDFATYYVVPSFVIIVGFYFWKKVEEAKK